MKMKNNKWCRMMATGASAICLATMAQTAHAQTDSAQSEPDEASGNALDVIIVTAKKREDDVQTLSTAVTAIGGEQIQETRLRGAEDVLNLTPGAIVTSSGPLEQLFSVRGISSGTEGASGDAGVLMMIDGEVISRDFMRSGALFDVGRIEVLRGPQGTTYGRNSTGGVFHIITNKPQFDLTAGLRVDIGNFGLMETESYVSGGLSDTVAARLSAYTQNQDGYSRDAVTGQDINFSETRAFRGQLLFETSDSLSVLLRSHYSDEDHGPKARKLYDPTLPYADPNLGFSFTELSTDPYLVSNTAVAGIQREIYGGSVEVNWSNDTIDIFSLTAIRRGVADVERDIFGTDQRVVIQSAAERATTLDQEIRISNAPSADNLTWMVGLFYLNEDTSRSETKVVLPDILGGFVSTEQNFTQSNTTDSIGIFGDVLLSLTDYTKLEVGLRYSRDEKNQTIFHEAIGLLADSFILDPSNPVQGVADASFDKITWKVSINQELAEDVFVYGSAGNGYKSGGFNPEPATDLDAVTPFDEEVVMSYEVGLKSEFFDNSLRFNLSLFHTDFTDIQAEFFTAAGSTVVNNVASAKISGIEMESLWRPIEALTLGLSGSLYDHEYDEFIDQDGIDNSGNPLANVPDWTISASVQLDIPLGSGLGSLRGRTDFRLRDDVNEDANPDPIFGVRPGEEMLDLRLAWRSESEAFEIAIWGQNVLDKAEITDIGPMANFSQRQVGYAAPRTYGISFSAKY